MQPLRTLLAGLGLFLLFQASVTAQITFQKSYGLPNYSSEGRDILEIQGGYILVGKAVSPVTGSDGLLMQLDAEGAVVWEKTYDLDGSEIFKSIVPSGDGGFIVLGESQPAYDAWVLKVDAGGNIVWQFLFDQPNGGVSGEKLFPVPGGFLLSGGKGLNNGVSSSYVIKINTDGQVLWSRSYQSVDNSLMTIGYVTDSLWYGGGFTGLDASVYAVDPQTGDLKTGMKFETVGSETLYYIAPAPDGNLVLSGFQQPFWPVNSEYRQWVQKISPSGTVIWSRIFQLDGQSNLTGPIIPIPSGGYLVCPGSGSNAPAVNAHLMKLDENGQVVWCNSFGNPNNHDWFLQAQATQDGGFIAVGFTAATVPGRTNVYVLKVNAEGELNGCCRVPVAVTHMEATTTFSTPVFVVEPFSQRMPSFANIASGNNPEKSMLCNVPLPKLEIQYTLCPGESFLLNGQEYAAPDTLVTKIPATAGACDTIVTYYLLDELAGQTSQILLQCPPNLVKTVAAGASAASVEYPSPTASTNCTCDGLGVQNLSGGVSGSIFPLGNHTVCWGAEDACGSSKTCCFTIAVEEEASSCDSKSAVCLRWELLDRKRTDDGDIAYRVRVTNTCASNLKYAYFGTPSGVLPLEPLANSPYEAESSRQYQVKNPNFSPFYGLRFQASQDAINGGQSDIFRFVIPKQTPLDYLHVAGRLENGTYSEAYLNTFYCPVGEEKNSVDRSAFVWSNSSRVSISPNPLVAGQPLRLEGPEGINGRIKFFNSLGRQVLEGDMFENRVVADTGLLPNGICFFQVLDAFGAGFSGVLVVGRD